MPHAAQPRPDGEKGHAAIFFVISSLWLAAKVMFDWVGRSTFWEDAQHARSLVERGLDWLFSTPPWVPGALALAFGALLIYWLAKPPARGTRAAPHSDTMAPTPAADALSANDLERICKPRLGIFFEDRADFYRTLESDNGLIFKATFIRVCNCSTDRLQACSVVLEEVRDKDNKLISQPSLPLILSEDSFLASIQVSDAGQITVTRPPEPKKEFCLFPDQRKSVDVSELCIAFDARELDMYLRYAAQRLPSDVSPDLPLDGAPYTILLRAYADVGRSVAARFRIEYRAPRGIGMIRLGWRFGVARRHVRRFPGDADRLPTLVHQHGQTGGLESAPQGGEVVPDRDVTLLLEIPDGA